MPPPPPNAPLTAPVTIPAAAIFAAYFKSVTFPLLPRGERAALSADIVCHRTEKS